VTNTKKCLYIQMHGGGGHCNLRVCKAEESNLSYEVLSQERDPALLKATAGLIGSVVPPRSECSHSLRRSQNEIYWNGLH